MNRKILTILAVFLIAVSMASVCAAELTKENDFDGLFKMKVTESDNFTNISDSQAYSSLLQASRVYANSNESIYVFVYSGNMNDALLAMTDGDYDAQYNVNNVNMTTEGDLTLLNKSSKMDAALKDYPLDIFVGLSDSNNDMTVFIGGNNATLLKEYAETIEF